MLESIQTLTAVSTFTWVITLLLAGSICWFLKAVVGSTGLAALFAPFLVLGSLLSNRFFTANSILLNPDKNTNSASISAIGILVALMAMIVVYVLSARMSEARSRARKVPDALTDPRAR